MKKLDEIMELMADEMADFKTAVLELQELSKQLVTMSIPISTDALENNLSIFLKKQETEKEITDEILKEIDRKLKRARVIPSYLLILFGLFGILALGLVGYFGYTANEKQEESFSVYGAMMEMKSQNTQYEDYFAAYPESHEEYCKWLEGGDQGL